MSDLRGYVKIHRKLLRSPIWGRPRDVKVALAVVLMARWKPGKHRPRLGKGVRVRRGELVTTLRELANTCLLSPKEVRGALDFLQKADFLGIHPGKRFTRIRVLKYSQYQANEEKEGQTTGQHRVPLGTLRGADDGTPYKESLRRVKKTYPAARGKRPAATAGRSPTGGPQPTDNGHDRDAVEAVLAAYFRLSGVAGTQAARDHKLRADWARQAKRLLSRLGGRKDLALECLQEKARQWGGLDWSLAGVANKAGDWLARKQAGR